MKKIIPINTTIDGCHKTIYARIGKLSWENYLGRLQGGGWDCQMTSILEKYEEDHESEATMKKIETAILTRERSEEEKARRRMFGDKGAKFKKGRIPKIDRSGVIGTVTTLVTKDLLIIEIYERDNPDREDMEK